MIHTPTAISIFVCLSMVQLMAVFISMRCTLCGHFLQVALTLILVVGYAIAASSIACKIRGLMVTVCPSQFATRRTLFHVLVGCGLLMLKVSRLKLPVIWLLVSMWLNTLTKSQIWTLDRKSGSAGMPRPISYAVFCLKKKRAEMALSSASGHRPSLSRATPTSLAPCRAKREIATP